MKKFLSVLAGMMLFSMTARAQTCPDYQSWNGSACEKITCPAGQFIDTDGCSVCPAGMYSESGWKSCTSCYFTTWSPAGSSKCTSCKAIPIPNGTCSLCTVEGICTQAECDRMYRWNGTECVPSQCEYGSYYNEETGTCKYCDVQMRICLDCNASGCLACLSGWGLNKNGRCVRCGISDCTKCEFSSDSTAVCVRCDRGYGLRDGKCVKCSTLKVGKGVCLECDESGCTNAFCRGSTRAFFNSVTRQCEIPPVCASGEYAKDGACQPCSNVPVANGTCEVCSDESTCTDFSCDSGYIPDYDTNTCVQAVTCKYPLKTVADYSGGCIGCCTD